jgi:hypothetical protein
VALVCLAAGAALVVVWHCFPEEGEGEGEGEEDVEGGGDSEKHGGERAKFIQVIRESDYEKL